MSSTTLSRKKESFKDLKVVKVDSTMDPPFDDVFRLYLNTPSYTHSGTPSPETHAGTYVTICVEDTATVRDVTAAILDVAEKFKEEIRNSEDAELYLPPTLPLRTLVTLASLNNEVGPLMKTFMTLCLPMKDGGPAIHLW